MLVAKWAQVLEIMNKHGDQVMKQDRDKQHDKDILEDAFDQNDQLLDLEDLLKIAFKI